MSVLSAATQQQVEDDLVKSGALTQDALKEIKAKAEAQHSPLLGLMVSEGQVSNEDLTKAIAKANKLPYVNLSNARVEPKILTLLPQDIAERYMAVPLGEMQHRLVVAMLDADNVQAVDFLSNKIGRPLKVYSASEAGIRNILKQYQASISESVADDISKLTGEISVEDITDDANGKPKAPGQAVPEGTKAMKTLVQDSPISKALSTILEFAAKNRASDVHIEPLQDSLKIRCRIDGILREIMKLPKSTEPPLVSRIKILSNLKIDEHRIPQDGEFSINVAGKDIDLRIAIAPVVWGEQVVIRLLDKSGTSLKLADMGYRGRALRAIQAGLTQATV
jgi:type IV pilus assembly protein PilB